MNNKSYNAIENKIEDVKRVLKILSSHEEVIFRGGTALSLTHEITKRFSEDIDISLLRGHYKVEELISQIKLELEKEDWVSKIESKDNKMFIYRKNEVAISPIFNETGYDLSRILIEWPMKFRKTKENELAFKKVKPFKEANFKMNVMDLEHILADKTFLIAKKFIFNNGDLKWMRFDNQARHAYDVQMILENKYIIEDKYFKFLIHKEILKKESDFLRGEPPRPELIVKWIKQKNAWIFFEKEIRDNITEIIETIAQIIYPNAKKFAITKFLRLYKSIFIRILELIKNEYNQLKKSSS